MAETNQNLVQHIDKISYGVAAVVGLALLILPVIGGGDLSATRMELNTGINELKKKQQLTIFPDPPKRELEKTIRSQWNPGDGGEDPSWVTGVAPALIKRAQSIQKRPATHVPGVIVEIAAHRDAEKKQVYLTVKGVMGEGNEFVVIDKVKLFRREGATGSFTQVGEYKGDFTYSDYKVNAGETYAYRFTTTASRDPNAPSNIQGVDSVEQESLPVETPPIPYDFSIDLKQTFQARESGQRPQMLADFKYWDYAKGAKVEEPSGRFTERDEIGGKRFQILRIDPSKREIVVKDRERRGPSETISSRDEPFPIDLWEPVSGVAAEASQGEEETSADETPAAAEETSAEPEETPAEPASTPSTGRRRPRF